MTEYALQYTISEADYMAAYEDHWRSKKQSTKSNAIQGAIGFFAGILLFWYVGVLGLILATAGALLLSMAFVRKTLHLRAYRSSLKYTTIIDTTFSDENIKVVSSVGESVLNWSIFVQCLETESFILLYVSSNSFSIIPKTALAGKVQEFVQFVKNKMAVA